MGRVARKVLGHIDVRKFERYLRRFSAGTIDLLAERLKEKEPNLQDLPSRECIERALLGALEEASTIRPGPKPAKDVDRLSIERELRKILHSIQSITADSPLVKLEYEAVKVSSKIARTGFNHPQNILLESIEHHVVLYYKFIESQIRLMENNAALDSEVLLKAVKSKYEQVRMVAPDAVAVYYSIREWLMEEAGSENENAADILTAFFIQNCEVFDVPSE